MVGGEVVSTDYRPYCLDCYSLSDSMERDRYYRVVTVCKGAPILVELARSVRPDDLKINGYSVDVEWLLAHDGHRIVPQNEYGEVESEDMMALEEKS
jgi:hypothetical protein